MVASIVYHGSKPMVVNTVFHGSRHMVVNRNYAKREYGFNGFGLMHGQTKGVCVNHRGNVVEGKRLRVQERKGEKQDKLNNINNREHG